MVTATTPSAPAVAGVEPLRLCTPPAWELTDDAFEQLCELNPEWRFEVDEHGRLVLMGSPGFESSFRSLNLGAQVLMWIAAIGHGRVSGADGFYRIRGRVLRAPDVAWVSSERLPQNREDREGMLRLCPDFVIEVRSISDRLPDQLDKMQFWIDSGARLAWLIDPFDDIAYIYRPGQEPEQLERPDTLSGEDVLPGLVVDFSDVWWPAS